MPIVQEPQPARASSGHFGSWPSHPSTMVESGSQLLQTQNAFDPLKVPGDDTICSQESHVQGGVKQQTASVDSHQMTQIGKTACTFGSAGLFGRMNQDLIGGTSRLELGNQDDLFDHVKQTPADEMIGAGPPPVTAPSQMDCRLQSSNANVFGVANLQPTRTGSFGAMEQQAKGGGVSSEQTQQPFGILQEMPSGSCSLGSQMTQTYTAAACADIQKAPVNSSATTVSHHKLTALCR